MGEGFLINAVKQGVAVVQSQEHTHTVAPSRGHLLPSSIQVMPSDHTSTFPSYWPSSMARITSGAILQGGHNKAIRPFSSFSLIPDLTENTPSGPSPGYQARASRGPRRLVSNSNRDPQLVNTGVWCPWEKYAGGAERLTDKKLPNTCRLHFGL